MFENLTNKFEEIFSSLKKAPSLDETQVDEGLRGIRQALLEADVSLDVAKDFIEKVKPKVLGQEIIRSTSPGDMVVKIVYDELVNLLGETNKITAAGSFTSNSFTRDQFALGAEYTFTHEKIIVILRGGMIMEKGLFDDAERQTALSGPTAGLSLDLPLGKNKSTLGVDYTYRTTSASFNGIHSIGVRLNLAKAEEE